MLRHARPRRRAHVRLRLFAGVQSARGRHHRRLAPREAGPDSDSDQVAVRGRGVVARVRAGDGGVRDRTGVQRAEGEPGQHVRGDGADRGAKRRDCRSGAKVSGPRRRGDGDVLGGLAGGGMGDGR